MTSITIHFRRLSLLCLVLLLPACTSSGDQITEYNPGCFVNNLIGQLELANQDPGPAVINLAENCDYVLEYLNNTDIQFVDSGLPVISNDITINGNNATISIPSGPQYYFGHFAVSPDGYLQLYDVTLQGGWRNAGGAIFNQQGRVLMTRTSIIGGVAYSQGFSFAGGGAIYNQEGIVSIVDNSVINNNSATVGVSYGGAIVNYHGRLLISESSLSGNQTVKEGGAIYSVNGYLNVTDSDLSNNSAAENGGAIAISRTDPLVGHEGVEIWGSNITGNEADHGGALYAVGETTTFYISSTTFANNTADYGGALTLDSSILTINDSTFQGNHARHCGGIEIANDSNVTVTGSLFQSNQADVVGGGICHIWGDLQIAGSEFIGNQAGDYGGGIVASDPVSLLTSTFDHNIADGGGGLYLGEVPTIFFTTGGDDPVADVSDSTFQNNTVILSGGGVSSMGELNVERSTFFNNTAQSGGAIYAGAGILNLTNSTVTTNRGTNNGAGLLLSGLVDADIVHCTIAYNRAIGSSGVVTGANVTFQNTILAHNRSFDCNNFSISGGSVSFEGENLDTDGSCDGFTYSSYDPQLESLADNGGYTQTHALHAGSIAIDLIDDCSPVDEDQRMMGRPQGDGCDLGAYEREVPAPPPPPPPPGTFLLQTTTEVNCRIGPHFDHMVVITFTTGHTATAIGRNEDGSWFAVAAPQELEETGEPWCWLPDAFVQREFSPDDLPELDHLPPPNLLEPRPPTKEPGEPEDCTGGTAACP